MKKVLVVGGSGMVGRNLIEHDGFASYTILAPSSSELDLRNFALVEEYLRDNRPDMVIHSAGLVGGIQANIENQVDFLVVNTDLGKNIILAARNAGVKVFINLASSCMYPRAINSELEEDMLLSGELEPTNEGYALAKNFSTKLCQYINREKNSTNFKTLIPCNLYGKYDKFDLTRAHMLPAVISKIHAALISNKNTVEIWGDGKARREFMYAGDFADAVFHATKTFDTLPEVMNVGLEQDYSITDYYEAVAEVLGWPGDFVFNLEKPVGMKRKKVSIARQKRWGWSPKTGLHEGIKKTYDYFLEEKV